MPPLVVSASPKKTNALATPGAGRSRTHLLVVLLTMSTFVFFGYTLWRTGYAIAAGGWTWGAVTASFFVYDFNFRGIPVLQHYLEERVSLSSKRTPVTT